MCEIQNQEFFNKVVNQLKNDEGFVDTPKRDHLGNWFVGYGFDISGGITEREATLILRERVRMLNVRLPFVIEGWGNLNHERQGVIINMAYNLGISGLLKFKKMLRAIKEEDFQKASEEMQNSLWAIQVGDRAKRLAMIMKSGE